MGASACINDEFIGVKSSDIETINNNILSSGYNCRHTDIDTLCSCIPLAFSKRANLIGITGNGNMIYLTANDLNYLSNLDGLDLSSILKYNNWVISQGNGSMFINYTTGDVKYGVDVQSGDTIKDI